MDYRNEVKRTVDQMCDYISSGEYKAAMGALLTLEMELTQIKGPLKEIVSLEKKSLTPQCLLNVMAIK